MSKIPKSWRRFLFSSRRCFRDSSYVLLPLVMLATGIFPLPILPHLT
uniref:Uncharacterized protein n=1 Tax=Rhizophora mucronata TaxID=61149 RepID=A0A2P2J2U4_RHIMU